MTEEKTEFIKDKEETLEHKEQTENNKSTYTKHKESYIEHKKDSIEKLKKRKENLINFFKKSPNLFYYTLLAIVILIGVIIRTRNINFLKDITTGKYIPIALDPFLFLRYAKTILETGGLPAIDMFRNVPLGLDTSFVSPFISYVVVFLYNSVRIFVPSLTLESIHIIYPVIFFGLSLIIFFLLIKRLFNIKVALLATAYLSFIPPFLYRTMAGFSDKEAFGMFLMFLTFYFYVLAWQSKMPVRAIIFGILAGITTALLGLSWGGVMFVFLIIALFAFIEILLNKFSRNDLFSYGSWIIISLIILLSTTTKYGDIFFSFQLGFPLFVLLTGIINEITFKTNILKIKDKFKDKLPQGIASLILSTIILFIISLLTNTTSKITAQFSTIVRRLHGAGGSRWVLTVAESKQPYFVEWMGSFGGKIQSLFLSFNIGKLFLTLFFLGLILLFYKFTEPIKQKKWGYILTSIFTIFILLFTLSRYSGSSIFNGISPLSKTAYIGSLFGFVSIMAFIYIYSFYKNKSLFNDILLLDKKYIFIMIWALILIIAARTAIRLLFVFASISVIPVAFILMESLIYGSKFKTKHYKYLMWAIISFIIYITLIPFAQISYGAAKVTGPSYDQQWQQAMSWVRENTSKDSVFAHWWDYGYWVQTGGERATILDGGNAIVYWNHLLGRHVLMGQNETEALEFLKVHNATHLLIIVDEIGKYPAYSSIGADENYDRYSQIGSFRLDTDQIQETRDENIFIYSGGAPLDQDKIINGRLFPGWSTGIGALIVPVLSMQNINGTFNAEFSTPSIVLLYQGQQVAVPVECIYFDNKEYLFDIPYGIKGCIRIIPVIEPGGRANSMGAAIYISEKVRNTLFAQMFLLNKEWPGFKLAYDDSNNYPLAFYSSRLIGPLKIWEVNYPENIEYKPEYLEKKFPNINLTLPR